MRTRWTFSGAPPLERGEDSGFPSEELSDLRGGLALRPWNPAPDLQALGEGYSSLSPQHSTVSSDPGLGCLPVSQ